MKRVKARKDEVSRQLAPRPRNLAGRHGALHRVPRPCALRSAASGQRQWRDARRRTHLPQCRRARLVPDMPGIDEVDYLTNTTILELDTLPRHLVDRRRQLYRARIRADVPPLRRRGDGRREGPAADRARGRGRVGRDPGDPRGRRHRGPAQCRMHRLRAARATALPSASTAPTGRRTCRLACAARDRAAAEHRRSRPGRGRRRDRRARLHHRRRPAADQRARHLGAGRLQRQAAPSPTPPTTTSRSSRRTCSTTTSAGSATASRPMRSTSTRRSAAPA